MKLFIFDCGEVILKNVDTFKALADYIGIEHSELLSDYSKYEMALMDGYMSPDDYYRHLEMKYAVVIDSDPFAAFFHPEVDFSMLSYVEKLRANGYRCVVGSNTFRPHWEIIRKLDGNPLGFFDALYPSHEIHVSKPEKAFFRYICSEEGVQCDEAVLIDDRKENTDSAASLGLSVLEYSGYGKEGRAEAFFSSYMK